MGYDRNSFLSGVAAGRNMESWPAFKGVPEGFSMVAKYAIKFTLYDAEGITVDWGDDTQTAIGSEGNPSIELYHSYSDSIFHTVTITPTFTNISFETWTPYAVLDPFPRSMSGVTNCQGLFAGCTELEYVHPALFSHMPNVTSFWGAFQVTTSLKSVPETLFAYCPLASDFQLCFYGSGIESIPEGLFSENPYAHIFQNCFYRAKSLKEIPGGLFRNNLAAYNFAGCFSECTALETIGPGLFYNNVNVNSFNSCFSKCTALTTVGANMFRAQEAKPDTAALMSGCTGITSNVPPLWELYPGSSGSGGYYHESAEFYQCYNAANYDQIPRYWK